MGMVDATHLFQLEERPLLVRATTAHPGTRSVERDVGASLRARRICGDLRGGLLSLSFMSR